MGCQASKAVPVDKNYSVANEGEKSNKCEGCNCKSSAASTDTIDSGIKAQDAGPLHGGLGTACALDTIHEIPIEKQIRQLPPEADAEADKVAEEGADATEEEWHHSIKVDQLALKLQSLSSDWEETKEQVHYVE
ncbi:hypothetical protein MPSEU_000776000 [Mayamaea pseudoterrestris]|nr:hypothetical protein MPSEU_000776000 [Mayamaea pseudoterrestris]